MISLRIRVGIISYKFNRSRFNFVDMPVIFPMMDIAMSTFGQFLYLDY